MDFDITAPSSTAVLVMTGIAGLLLVLGLLLGVLAISMSGPKVSLSGSSLSLKVPLYGRSIPVQKLVVSEAEVVDLAERESFGPGIRTNGIGLPGYLVGWFRLKDGSKALLALTDRRQVLYLPTREDYVLLLSVQDPQGLIQKLRGR